MIIVDSSIVAYFVIPGVNTKMAESVRAKDSVWHAPALLRQFVALAEETGVQLVTTDKEVLKAFQAITVHPQGF